MKISQLVPTLLVVGSLAFMMTGCESSSSEPLTLDLLISQAEADGGPDQVAMLEDGELTTAELKQSIDAMFDCFDAHGLDNDYEGVNPVDGWRPLYGVDARDRNAVDDCRRTTYKYIELGYELLNEDVMDPALMAVVQACMIDAGVALTGQEKSLSDLAPQGGEDEARIELVRSCAASQPIQFPSMIFVFE